MRGHVDAESLALCAEGLLSRRRSERIRSHLASCPECAAAQARLAEVPALLATVPQPALPPGIAARLDAALSAETARRAAAEAGTAPDHGAPATRPAGTAPHPGTTSPSRPDRARGLWLRIPAAARALAVAGALVAVGGIGYAVSQSLPSSSGQSSSAQSSAGAPAVAGPRTGPSPDARSGPRASATGSAPGRAPFGVRQSGTHYRRSTLATQAATVLRQSSAGVNHPGASNSGGPEPGSPPAVRKLTGCVNSVAGPATVRAGQVKLVDKGSYQGRPATVIVVQPASTQPGTVYVAGARCSAAHADILARATWLPSG